ncbi:MAG: peptidylprolyl isomerase, partial [Chitinophagaceae bacterium]|nr:peptidylprolyl isomerase [Chitinophagaceae bacterium]
MNKTIFLISFLAITSCTEAQKPALIKLETKYGNCIIKLYNETPLHRDNLIKLIKSKYFDTTTFNRIIKGFVIQGGDTDSMYL